MDTRVHELQQQIALLEDELRLAIRDREAKMRFAASAWNSGAKSASTGA